MIRIVSGVQVHAWLERSILHRNNATQVFVEKRGTCQTRLSLPNGWISETRISFEHEPLVVPNRTANFSPMAEVVNLSSDRGIIQLSLNNVTPETAVADLDAPTGWQTRRTDAEFAVTIGSNPTEGVETSSLTLDCNHTHSVRFIKHAHTAQRH